MNEIEIRVRYAETDQMGRAYYSHYYQWFEVGRTELLRNHGLVYNELEQQGVFLPVTESYCRYRVPAKYDDVIIIQTSVQNLTKASIKFNYKLFNKKNNQLLAEGYTVHIFVNLAGKPIRPPAIVKETLNQC